MAFLELRGLSKAFGPTVALSNVTLSVGAGEILGLAGENGAGKSTLIKTLSGVVRPDRGEMSLAGEPHAPQNPAEAEARGVSVFYQEIPICPDLSVTANVFLGPKMARRRGMPDWRRMYSETERLFEEYVGEVFVDPTIPMGECSAAQGQLALLVRVLSRQAQLIVLDEPTTAITPPEVQRLFGVIRRLRERGVTFIFVSHMTDELIDLSDRIAVLRDGALVGEIQRREFEPVMLSNMIAGRRIERQKKRVRERGRIILEALGLSDGRQFRDVSFTLREGEVLGLAGLQGSGRTEVMRALFGARRLTEGRIRLSGEETSLDSPGEAIRKGIGYVPEDRKSQGIFYELDVQTNLTISAMGELRKGVLLDRHAIRRRAERVANQLSVKTPSIDAPITSLSGGNQQKVLLGRILAVSPRTMLFNEPVRGVDVGAKAEIVRIVTELAEKGYACLVSSSELEELMAMADRVLVFREGRIVRELSGEGITKANIVYWSTVEHIEEGEPK